MATALTNDAAGHSPSEPTKERIVVGTGASTWIWSPQGWDLTHPIDPQSDADSSENGVQLDCDIVNITIDPLKTALVITDMQNMALNKALDPPTAPAMYEAQNAMVRYTIPAARKLGLQIIWLNCGLTEDDLANLPPAEVRVFAFKVNSPKTDYGLGDRLGDPNDPNNFIRIGERPNLRNLPGAELGEIILEDGSKVNAGRAMMRGAWNTALYGSLADAYEEGSPGGRMCTDPIFGFTRTATRVSGRVIQTLANT